jgi:hypothetical protein
MTNTTFKGRKAQFPGGAVLDAEFRAVATPEQVALFEATLAANPCAGWTTDERSAYYGLWSVFNGKGKGEGADVLHFDRRTGAIEVTA